jgi:hypothetical protein
LTPHDRAWAREVVPAGLSLETFVTERLPDAAVHTALHFRPQVDFLHRGAGGIGVDFMGRFERLPEDFATVRDRLRLKSALPHLNPTRDRHSVEWTPAMAAVVQRLYARDFEELGYPADAPA